MKHRNSHLLVGYWSRLRRGRPVPDQTEIDPRAIKRMLASVFILDAQDPARPLYRLAGTQLCDRYGSELKGTNFLNQWESGSRSAVVQLLRQALTTRQPVCLSSLGSAQSAGMVEVETVLAPVSFGAGAPTRFIGLVHVLGDAVQLAGRPIAFQRLIGAELVQEDEPADDDFTRPTLPPMPPRDGIRSHPRAPHLRLVVSRPTLHRDAHALDRDMADLVRALELGPPRLTCLKGGMQPA